MKTYRSKEEVQAIKVGNIHGSYITEAKPGKGRIVAGDKGVIDIGYTFAGQNVIRVGDYVVFRGNLPIKVMTAGSFEAEYAAKKSKPKN